MSVFKIACATLSTASMNFGNQTANLYEPASLDDFSETLKSSEKVVAYFYTSFSSACKITKPIIHSLAYKCKDILFFLINVDRYEDIADEYGSIKRRNESCTCLYKRHSRSKVVLFQHGKSKAEISSLGHYAAYRLNPYEMYERKDQYYFA
ncbi:hypothetical protein AB4K20DRAFT_1954123 [Rhizopus microsporus]|uniref:Thioredoxin domain-containing protein n=1 Tax=Rhizopus microsporus TaxID=58291 RepID=A0A1X0S6G9_RHIZD|nr:hypothetical protein BCV71DRAFT_289855 [Rhizopus microsporus]